MVNVKTYWERIDAALMKKGLTMTDLARDLGYKRETIYGQKRLGQYPKPKQMADMEKYLGIDPMQDEVPDKYSYLAEYIPYFEKAEEWQIKAIREILRMPEKKSNMAAV